MLGSVRRIPASRCAATEVVGQGATTSRIGTEIRRGGATPPGDLGRKQRPRGFVRQSLGRERLGQKYSLLNGTGPRASTSSTAAARASPAARPNWIALVADKSPVATAAQTRSGHSNSVADAIS